MAKLIEHIRAAAFDLDGTLVDTAPDLGTAVNGVLKQLGHATLPAERIPALIGEGVERLLAKALAESTGGLPSPATLTAAATLFARLYRERLFEDSRVYPGVVDALSQLQHAGIALCCVTNKHSKFALPLLEEARLHEHFAFTLCADRVEDRKPRPNLLLAACARLAVRPEEALYVGDSHTDLAAAEAAGCRVLVVDYGYDHGRPVSDLAAGAVISSLTEILTMQERADRDAPPSP
jgi:phosphoglycolate phosphatase